MKNLESHMMCPLENCNRNNQGCAYLRVKNKIDTKKTETEGKFKTIVSFIDELVLSLDQFICSEIQLMNGKNIFGVVEDKIVLQLNQDEYILVEYDVKRDQVIFHLGKEISTEEIEKIKSNDTLWY
jgi:tyrosine-protein phosphatase YwqE